MMYRITFKDRVYDAIVKHVSNDHVELLVSEMRIKIPIHVENGTLVAQLDDTTVKYIGEGVGDNLLFSAAGDQIELKIVKESIDGPLDRTTGLTEAISELAPEGRLVAPMPGKVLSVKVGTGDSVKNGDIVIILEAMKMENEITATKDGKIKEINVKPGDSVKKGQALLLIE
ncbi:MAG: biotin/lipoyl-containing protein [Candidatus Hodarchaeales archaeon]